MMLFYFFLSSRRRHTRCALVTGVQTCALPIYRGLVPFPIDVAHRAAEHLRIGPRDARQRQFGIGFALGAPEMREDEDDRALVGKLGDGGQRRSEEHTSELQSLMRNSYAVFCLKKNKTTQKHTRPNINHTNTL